MHSRMLKNLVALALGLSTLAVLAGCSGGAGDPALDEAAPPPAEGAVPAAAPPPEKEKNRPQGNTMGQ